MTNQNATPTPPTGTIDITNLVVTLRNTWIRWATKLVISAASSTIYTAWLKWPVVGTLFEMLVKMGVTAIANGLEMQGFFLNTAIRKASQAEDFIAANDALNALPPTVTDEEYENAEKREMAAFRNFVRVTN
jgi:hypothetical protein